MMTPKIKVAVGPCSGIDTSEYLDGDGEGYQVTFDDDTTLAMRTIKMKKIMIRTKKIIGKERRSWEIVALARFEPKEKLIIMIFPKFEEEKRC